MNGRARQLVIAAVLLVSLGKSTTALGQAQAAPLAPFRADYVLFNGDKRVGESEFSLQYDAAKRVFVFETRARFQGLLGLMTPRPVIERSEFVLVDGRARPLTFAYRDGSRRGQRNLDLRFDWGSRTLVIERDGASQSTALSEGVQDRASARVELALALARAQLSGVLQIADPDVPRSYTFTHEADEIVETPLGPLHSRRIAQQRDGSSRRTLTWAAAELGFQAVKIEQQREDRDPVAFVLESFEWLGDAPDATSN